MLVPNTKRGRTYCVYDDWDIASFEDRSSNVTRISDWKRGFVHQLAPRNFPLIYRYGILYRTSLLTLYGCPTFHRYVLALENNCKKKEFGKITRKLFF